jgi:uncharacterized integral membrane protein
MAAGTGKRSRVEDFHVPGTNLRGGRAIAVVVLVVYLVLFVLLNTRRVQVNFVFFKLHSHVLIAFALVAVLGFLAGYFVRGRRASGGDGG